MIELTNKRSLVVGVANEQSLAWGIAQALHRAGAKLAITYLNQQAEPFVRPLAAVDAPSPMATRAAGGIANFDEPLEEAVQRSPMRRLATIEEAGAATAFLSSDIARNITGCVLHVDAGRPIMG
jgi:enoyl-[acyl-carrier protein] reductase I